MTVTGWPTDRDATADVPTVVADPLDEDPFSDDLAERLAALAPRPVGRTTDALVGLVVLVAGFVGGVLVQKTFGPAPSTGRGNLATNLPAGGPLGGPGGQADQGDRGDASGSTTTGTVKLVDGTTVYITLSNGEVATVRTSDRATVAVQESVGLSDLEVGQTVSVRGAAGSDGVITATEVTAEK
jgi:hypothetical protein